MEDAAQSSADEVVSEVVGGGDSGPFSLEPLGLFSLEPLTSEQEEPFLAAFSRNLAAQQQAEPEQQMQQQLQ